MERPTRRAYQGWVHHYKQTPLFFVLSYIPYIPYAQRKVLLAYTRIQNPPVDGSRMYLRYREVWDAEITLPHLSRHLPKKPTPAERFSTTLRELVNGFPSDIYSPFAMGFLSMAVRCAPYEEYDTVSKVKVDAIEKEINAAVTPYQETHFDFSPFFRPTSFATPISSRMTSNPIVARHIHSRLLSLRSHYYQHPPTLYPKTSRKRAAPHTYPDEFRCSTPFDDDQSYLYSEQVYSWTGYQNDGISEMRSAWKYNDLKPRIYYAGGGRLYHASKYIHAICNDVVDTLSTTHRISRFQPLESMVPKTSVLALYDYSSFTSNLDMLYQWLIELANFFEGVQCTLIDTHYGPTPCSLKDLLLEYAEVCNKDVLFDAGRLTMAEGMVLFYHTAGLLGVPGNIVFSTALHGQHLAMIVDDPSEAKSVGDDARCSVKDGDFEDVWWYFMNNVRSLGPVNDDKFETWTYEEDVGSLHGWQFVKRPYCRISQRETFGQLVQWPNFAHAGGFDQDSFHTPSFHGPHDIAVILIRQFCRVLDLCRMYTHLLTDLDRELVVLTQKQLYQKIEFLGVCSRSVLYHKGFIKIGTRLVFAPKHLDEESVDKDWRRLTIQDFSGDREITIPEFGCGETLSGIVEFEAEDEFEHNGTRGLSLLTRLGYYERRMVWKKYRVSDFCEDDLVDISQLRYPCKYTYYVVFDVPPQLRSVALR